MPSLRQALADVFRHSLFDFADRALDFAQSFADAAFHVAGDFAHDPARQAAALGHELAGRVEHAAHEGGNLAAEVVDQVFERSGEGSAARER